VRILLALAFFLAACSDASPAPAQTAEPVAQPAREPAPAPAPPTTQPDTASFARVLTDHLRPDGRFDYAALHGDEARMADLHEYVSSVGEARPDSWSRDEQLAFYLNAYNALVLLAVDRRWPIDSVMHEDGFFDTDKYMVAGEDMTLNALETDLIRQRFHEPRIHFAVNCASVGCPRLWPAPFTRANLEAELERRARLFVRATTQVDREHGTMTLSKIFEWFAPDFAPAGGHREFVAARLDAEDATVARNSALIPQFAEYNWALNSAP